MLATIEVNNKQLKCWLEIQFRLKLEAVRSPWTPGIGGSSLYTFSLNNSHCIDLGDIRACQTPLYTNTYLIVSWSLSFYL